ncbi:hypothetical protein ACA910_017958 [Epithemia clementina (nom. ined.)]
MLRAISSTFRRCNSSNNHNRTDKGSRTKSPDRKKSALNSKITMSFRYESRLEEISFEKNQLVAYLYQQLARALSLEPNEFYLFFNKKYLVCRPQQTIHQLHLTLRRESGMRTCARFVLEVRAAMCVPVGILNRTSSSSSTSTSTSTTSLNDAEQPLSSMLVEQEAASRRLIHEMNLVFDVGDVPTKTDVDAFSNQSMLHCPACMEDVPESQVMFFFCTFEYNAKTPSPVEMWFAVFTDLYHLIAAAPGSTTGATGSATGADGRHFLCFDCAAAFVTVNKSPPIRCCFQGCPHELIPQEIALALGRGSIPVGVQSPTYREIDALRRDYEIIKDPQSYASCPSPNCKWVMRRSSKGAIEQMTCPICNVTFCSNCSNLYHYHGTTCIEFQQMKRSWHNWFVYGKSLYWKDSKNKRSLVAAIAEQQRVRNVQRTEMADERYKAAHCRHCPFCARLVERVSGCDHMVCGHDSESGRNRQPGCRRMFQWNTAKPYQPITAGQNVKYVTPREDYKRFHHVDKVCDQCGSTEIRGLLLECVNCPNYRICEKCDFYGGAQHRHVSSHVFSIQQGGSMKKQEEWSDQETSFYI